MISLLGLALAMIGLGLAVPEVVTDGKAPNGWDFATYGGLLIIVPWGIEILKKLRPTWVDTPRECKLWTIGLVVLIGIASKLLKFGFVETNWTAHMVLLIVSGIGGGPVHDNMINPLIGKKSVSVDDLVKLLPKDKIVDLFKTSGTEPSTKGGSEGGK